MNKLTISDARRALLCLFLLLVCALPDASWARCTEAMAATDRVQSGVAAEATAREALTTIRRNAQDWKNLLLRGRDPAERQVMQGRFDAQAKAYEAQLAQLRTQLVALRADVGPVDKLDGERDQLFTRYRAALSRHGVGTLDAASAADREVQGADVATFRLLEQLTSTLAEQNRVQFEHLRIAVAHCGAPIPGSTNQPIQ